MNTDCASASLGYVMCELGVHRKHKHRTEQGRQQGDDGGREDDNL